MAGVQGDGSIVLKTKVDTTGLNRGLSSMKGAVTKFAKGFTVVTAAATAATVAITKMAVSAYADYEQLVGGVETLFKDSADKVVQYANQAYKAAGVSANEYMRQVTSFSASLIRSTAGDTSKAADIANMALIDISDNVNKMGSSMESVTLAYQGFAKQQYMLLDNLKLGYGGTKTEMERLLKDARALTGVKYDINNLADVYSAIHAIQEELGITGTTAKEAEKTITGSANAMKAAWQNVLSAIAGGGDLDKAIQNLTKSISIYFKNIVPVVEKALSGVGQVIAKVAPQLMRTLAKALVEAIPELVIALVETIIGVVQGVFEGIVSLFTKSNKEIESATEATENMTKTQQGLTEAIKETTKAQQQSLAGFDEINTLSNSKMGALNISTEGIANAVGGMLKVSQATQGATGDVEELSTVWDDFFYGVVGKTSVSSIKNLENATIKLSDSFGKFSKNYATTFSGIWELITGTDWEQITADVVTMQNNTTAGLLTSLSGGFDVLSGVYTRDFNTSWQGIGEIIGGSAQANIAFWDFLGVDMEEAKELFYPIYEEIPNLYKGITTAQAQALDVYVQQYNDIVDELRDTTYGVKITDKEKEAAKKQLDELSSSILEYAEKSKKKALTNLTELVDKGMLSEKELKKAQKKVTTAYSNQEKIVNNSQKNILRILENAATQERELTTDERAIISEMLDAANKEMISTISAGAASREKIERDLNNLQGQLATTHLSEVIRFANEEYNEKVTAAQNTYDETIRQAEVAYYELGVISEEQYNKIVTEAQNQKDGEIKAAKESREELVKLAQEKAGEIANTVDPETGEIYSKWEVLWNKMADTVKSVLNKVIRWINKTFGSKYGVLGSVAGWFGADVPYKTLIPELANGAVIPPNRRFLAVLGDQTHGTNIEAPLDTIKQAVAEVLAQVNVGGGYNGRIEVPVMIDGREIARAVRESEDNMGSQTVFGGFANVY